MLNVIRRWRSEQLQDNTPDKPQSTQSPLREHDSLYLPSKFSNDRWFYDHRFFVLNPPKADSI